MKQVRVMLHGHELASRSTVWRWLGCKNQESSIRSTEILMKYNHSQHYYLRKEENIYQIW